MGCILVNLRICHMIPGFFPIAKGGAEIFVLSICKELKVRGHKVHILTRNLNLVLHDEIEGIKITRFKNPLPYTIKYHSFGRFLKSKYLRILVAALDVWGALRSFKKMHLQQRFHLLHASFILPLGLVGLVAKKLFNVPIVLTVHGPADFYEVPRILSPILRFVLEKSDGVAVVSSKLKYDLMKRFKNVPLNVILNGIALKPFNDTPKVGALRRYNIEPEDFVILTAGRFVKRKNFGVLIDSLPPILEKIPRCKLVILGSGIEKPFLEDSIARLKLNQNVIMPGWISEDEKIRIFKRADTFVQLSEIEGLSLALLESKAAGIPAIIFGEGSKLDPVVEGETGFFIPSPLTIDKIVQSITKLYNAPNKREMIGLNAMKEAKALYSLEKMTDKYLDLYHYSIFR